MSTEVPQIPTPELNIKEFVKKAWHHKFIFLASLLFFCGLGMAYIKWVPPTYEVDTSILVDTKSNDHIFGESQSMEGGVQLGGTKNLFNEMNLLKSVDLIRTTLMDLNFNVSYHTRHLIIEREKYKDFPYTVELVGDAKQLIDVPINIEILSEERYRIIIDAKEYHTLSAGYVEKIEQPLHISKDYLFGESAETNLYHFIVRKNFDQLVPEEFMEKETYFQVHNYDDLIRNYQNVLSVNQVDLQSSIVNISSEGEVLQKETDFLNQLTKNYIAAKVNQRNQIADSKVSFIENQLSNISDSLARAERTLEIFRRNSDAVNLTQTGANAMQDYQELQTKQAQSDLNLGYYQSLLDYVEDSSGTSHVVAPSVVGINDAILNENLLDLKRLSSELSRVKFLKGEKSIDLEVIKHQIADTKNSLRENLSNLIASTKMTRKAYAARQEKLEKTIDMLPTREKNLLNYQRTTKLYENLYNYLSQELAKTGIAQAEHQPDINIVNEARMIGSGPKAPQKELILLLSALLGLLVPSLFISLRDDIDDTINSLEAVEAATNIPVLAQIATDPTLRKKDTIIAEHWQTKESIRDLHANIKFFLPNYWKKVIAVTSSVPGEGKSFVAANLAMTMASAGNNVLLIDADFRNPTLSRHFGVNPTKNFSTYLNGWTDDTKEIIHTHSKYRNLHYITTTAASTNPHRYLQNPKFEYLTIGLKDEYDHIIIDCPAIGLVSDYLLLFHLADIHLFVMKQKFSKLSHLDAIKKFKEKGNVENLYLVLNGVPGKKLKHGYFAYDSSVDQQSQNNTEEGVVVRSTNKTTH